MGRAKGFESHLRGAQGPRKRPRAKSPLIKELMKIMDDDGRGVDAVLDGVVNKVTVSRWRGGHTKAISLRAVEDVGKAYGYRLRWEKIG